MQNNFAICRICTYLRHLVFGVIDIVFSVVSPGIGLGSSFLYICTLTKRHDRINDSGSNPARIRRV